MDFRTREVRIQFARPDNVTAYAAGDVITTAVAAPIPFQNASPYHGGIIEIKSAKMLIQKPGAVPAGMAAFRLHLFIDEPVAGAIADNSPFTLDTDDLPLYLGYVTIPLPIDLGDNDFAQVVNLSFTGKLLPGSSTVYGVLETIEAWTPLAELPFQIILVIGPA